MTSTNKEPEGYRRMKNIYLPTELWREIDADAKRSGRSTVKQVESIFNAYYNRNFEINDEGWKMFVPKKKEVVTFGGKPVVRNIFLTKTIWDFLRGDAVRCRRSMVGQMELILATYYEGDDGSIDSDYLAFLKVRVSAPKPQAGKVPRKRKSSRTKK
ncbi:MAG: hypothetical protein QOH63_473 [Acidobacteriota bacterium]|jgi:hypothetical protein|nr:hypothetical protein [Acidobacteriota bacterium]